MCLTFSRAASLSSRAKALRREKRETRYTAARKAPSARAENRRIFLRIVIDQAVVRRKHLLPRRGKPHQVLSSPRVLSRSSLLALGALPALQDRAFRLVPASSNLASRHPVLR